MPVLFMERKIDYLKANSVDIVLAHCRRKEWLHLGRDEKFQMFSISLQRSIHGIWEIVTHVLKVDVTKHWLVGIMTEKLKFNKIRDKKNVCAF